jgi:hypothetical protein
VVRAPEWFSRPVDVNLAPGKEIELYELNLELSERGLGAPRGSTLYGTGKFSVQYERVLGNSSLSSVAIKLDPILGKLATGKLELEVREAAKRENRVFTPEELMRAANSLAADEKVVVQFKVRLVQPSPQLRKGVGKDDGWVVGHGPDDLGLYPQDRQDYTQEQFAAILTARAKQQLKRLGINDVGNHFEGNVVRVTGRVSSYLPFTDDPVGARQFDLVIDDVSQIENVD